MELRTQMVDIARRMNACGLNQGTSGNLSTRRPDGEGIYVTPSGRAYETMDGRDMVAVDWDGAWRAEGEGLRPSSEWRFHRDILSVRKEFGGVVHAHPTYATALAVHGRGIDAFHYMVAIAGGADIRCASYATFGTQELSDNVVAALAGRKACLIAHHGLIACGGDVEEALKIAVEVECLARQYIAALALGEPPLLSSAEMERVLKKFAAGYGYGATDEAE